MNVVTSRRGLRQQSRESFISLLNDTIGLFKTFLLVCQSVNHRSKRVRTAAVVRGLVSVVFEIADHVLFRSQFPFECFNPFAHLHLNGRLILHSLLEPLVKCLFQVRYRILELHILRLEELEFFLQRPAATRGMHCFFDLL
jgi:hypothetical protein